MGGWDHENHPFALMLTLFITNVWNCSLFDSFPPQRMGFNPESATGYCCAVKTRKTRRLLQVQFS